MELLLLVCAEAVVLDSISNQMSVFNILEDINTPTFPVMAPKVSVIAILSKNASEAQKASLQLRITLDGRKQTLLDTPMNIDFQGRLQSRIITKIQGMPIPAPGIMRINVTSKKGYLGTWNIRVNRIGQSTISTASPRARSDPASKAIKRSKKK